MDSQYAELFESVEKFDAANFTQSEIQIVEQVISNFTKLKTKQVVELSHLEKAWIANQENRDLTSYQQFWVELQSL